MKLMHVSKNTFYQIFIRCFGETILIAGREKHNFRFPKTSNIDDQNILLRK